MLVAVDPTTGQSVGGAYLATPYYGADLPASTMSVTSGLSPAVQSALTPTVAASPLSTGQQITSTLAANSGWIVAGCAVVGLLIAMGKR